MKAPVIRNRDLGDKLINDYLDVFNTYSLKNEMYGRISLHVLLGQALKNVHYVVGSRIIDLRVHQLLIKPQGTGKGAGYGFVKRMAEDVGLNFQSLTESTDAGLVGTLDKDKETGEMMVVDGLLKTADIVGMEEASVIFDYTSEFSKKNMTYMQICMNPLHDSSCHITKKLGTEVIDFKPHASFVLLTYPPDKLVDKLLKTGFIDRVIPIFEDVTIIDRLEVIRLYSGNINALKKDDAEKRFKSVANRLRALILKYQKGDIQIKIPDDVDSIAIYWVERFATQILDASPKAREKLEHFISRLYEIIIKLASHHALLCKRTTLSKADVGYAGLIYQEVWNNLIVTIESLLIVSSEDRLRRNKIINFALQEFQDQVDYGKFVKHDLKGRPCVRRRTMLMNLREKWDNCSIQTADRSLGKLEKTKFDSTAKKKFGNIAKHEKDKYFERVHFGNVAYLRKVKGFRR